MSKQEQILKILTNYLEQNPSVRFGQALVNTGIIACVIDPNGGLYKTLDPFYDSDADILKRMTS